LRPTFSSKHFCVFDNILAPSDFETLWKHYHRLPLEPVPRTDLAWRFSDGEGLRGTDVYKLIPAACATRTVAKRLVPTKSRLYPTRSPFDPLLRVIARLGASHEQVVGRISSDWFCVTLRAYLYPREAALSWHRDSHLLYTGAFVYYAHPEWGASWGGDLMIADEHFETSDSSSRSRRAGKKRVAPSWSPRFQTKAYSNWLVDSGVGHYVMAKPNRLVLIGGAIHCISPIRPAAGNHVRASAGGFFLRTPTVRSRAAAAGEGLPGY
jgi:hypothetical protein